MSKPAERRRRKTTGLKNKSYDSRVAELNIVNAFGELARGHFYWKGVNNNKRFLKIYRT